MDQIGNMSEYAVLMFLFQVLPYRTKNWILLTLHLEQDITIIFSWEEFSNIVKLKDPVFASLHALLLSSLLAGEQDTRSINRSHIVGNGTRHMSTTSRKKLCSPNNE